MAWITIVILSVVQGIAEFLPISSSGHLVVLYNFFSITENLVLLSVFLHIATLMAVVVVYKSALIQLIKKPLCNTNLKLITATIPTIIIVLVLKEFVTNQFNGSGVIYSFLITAILLAVAQITIDKRNLTTKLNGKSTQNTDLLSQSDVNNYKVSYKQALLIGVAQGFASIPGISRSGATVATGLIAGVDKRQVADFSFLLSIPIILASLVYELFNLNTQSGVLNFTISELLIGFIVAFVVGIASIKIMLKIVKEKKLWWFSIYLVIISLMLVVYGYVL